MASLVDEFGLEPDRRAVGNDLQIMIGQPRQQRSARHLGDLLDIIRQTAFGTNGGAHIRGRRAISTGGEIEQDTVWREVRDAAGFEVLDRGIVAAVEQRYPIIVSTDMHAALVGADRRNDVIACFYSANRGQVEFARMLGVTVHSNVPTSPNRAQSARKA